MSRFAVYVLLMAVSCTVPQSKVLFAADGEQAESKIAANEPKESIDVRYARATLELAKLDLQRAEEGNKTIKHLFSAGLVARLRQNLRIAEEQLKHSLQGDQGHLHQVHVRGVEAAVKIAAGEAKRIRSLHQKSPTLLSELNVKRSQAAVRVARLSVERARDPRNFQSEIPHLQWQIEELRQQVLELQLKVEQLSNRY